MRSFIFIGTIYMDKKLTLFTSSGARHKVLTIEQLSNLSLSFPFVGSKEQYETFLGIVAILRPDNNIVYRYAGTSHDVPFGSLIWWIEYTQEF